MKTEEFTIKKSTVEMYKIRHESGMYWADITIDSQGNTGRIQIASDYGDYQNYWGACGTSFKEFLGRIGIDYAATKFGADQWFDLDQTISQLKRRIKEYTQHDVSKDLKTELLEELKELEESSGKEEFTHKMWNSDKIMEMEDNCPYLVSDITPQFKLFWKNVWPILLKEFEKELTLDKTLI